MYKEKPLFHPVDQYDMNGRFIRTFDNRGDAARAVGSSSSYQIAKACDGQAKSCKGYIWKWGEKPEAPEWFKMKHVFEMLSNEADELEAMLPHIDEGSAYHEEISNKLREFKTAYVYLVGCKSLFRSKYK